MSLKHLNIQKTIFIFLLIFFTIGYSKVYSAPTDCIQFSEDGTINCSKAKSEFYIGGAKRFDTFEALIEYEWPKMCELQQQSTGTNPLTCYIQYQNEPSYPPAGKESCSSSPTCNKFTKINYNTSSNDSGSLAITYYYPNNSRTIHSQHTSVIYHMRTCPLNTTAVSVGSNTYLRYCKPYEIYYNPAPCDTGQCNKQTGSSTLP